MHPLLGQKGGQPLLALLLEDGEVAAIDHLHPQGPDLAHQAPEQRMEFGGSTGEIEAGELAGLEHGRDERHRGGLHAFGAVRTCRHMAVAAGLVAAVAQVHLQGGENPALEGGKLHGQPRFVSGVCSLNHADRSRVDDRHPEAEPLAGFEARGPQPGDPGRPMEAAGWQRHGADRSRTGPRDQQAQRRWKMG